MEKRHIRILIVVSICIAVIGNSPFLPGPSILSIPTNIIYTLFQIIGIVAFCILLPIGIIISIVVFNKKKSSKTKAISLSLIVVPTMMVLSTTLIAHIMRTLSREVAIYRCDRLIKDVEAYKVVNGHYPYDLKSSKISKPSTLIAGISGYQYESTGKDYTIEFAQNVLLSFNFEIVRYDKTDHKKAEGELKTLYNTRHKHWKYYIYD